MHIPILLVVTCPALSELSHGRVSYSQSAIGERYPSGTVGSFRCNDGYHRQGSSFSTCQTSENWSNQSPTCKQSNEITILISASIMYI